MSDHDEPGTTKVSKKLIGWLQSNCGSMNQSGNVRVEVNSDSIYARELVSRIREELDVLPASFWHIEYSENDIAGSDLFHLWCTSYIAEMAHPPASEILELKATKALKRPIAIGGVRPFGSIIAVNQCLKDDFLDENLLGLKWDMLRAHERKEGHQTIWQMSSSVILPASPIPLKQSHGAPFDGDPTKGCLYRSPYREVELAYFRESIISMEQFDVALSKECIGNYVGGSFPELVISQKFRKFLISKKLRGLKFIPVRLLQPGEPVIRHPLDALIHGVI